MTLPGFDVWRLRGPEENRLWPWREETVTDDDDIAIDILNRVKIIPPDPEPVRAEVEMEDGTTLVTVRAQGRDNVLVRMGDVSMAFTFFEWECLKYAVGQARGELP